MKNGVYYTFAMATMLSFGYAGIEQVKGRGEDWQMALFMLLLVITCIVGVLTGQDNGKND